MLSISLAVIVKMSSKRDALKETIKSIGEAVEQASVNLLVYEDN